MDLGDAMTAANSSGTPVTIRRMILTTNLPSAGWASQVTANISIVIDTSADIFVQLLSARAKRQVCAMLLLLYVEISDRFS